MANQREFERQWDERGRQWDERDRQRDERDRERDERDRERDERQERRDQRLDGLVQTLTDRTIQAMEAINRLGNIAGAHDMRLDEHEERLDHLEGEQSDLP